MADISYKNKKFPLKAVPTISLAFIVAAISSISVMYFLDDDENFLDTDDKKKIKKLIKKSSIKDIIKIISKNKKISKKEIYNFCLNIKNES